MEGEKLQKLLRTGNLVALVAVTISLPLLVFVSLQNTHLLGRAVSVLDGDTGSSCSPVIETVSSTIQGESFDINGHDFGCTQGKVYLSNIRDWSGQVVQSGGSSIPIVSWSSQTVIAKAPSGFATTVDADLYIQTAEGKNSNIVAVRFYVAQVQLTPMVTATPTPPPAMIYTYCYAECPNRGYDKGVCRPSCLSQEVNIGSPPDCKENNEVCCCSISAPTPMQWRRR